MSIETYVLGRVGADLYPQQINTPLEEVRTFERFWAALPATSPRRALRGGRSVASACAGPR